MSSVCGLAERIVSSVPKLEQGTPWSLNSLFKAILNSLFDYPFWLFSSQFPPSFLPKHFQCHPQIVGNTPKITPANFLKKSLNSLFIDPGVERKDFGGAKKNFAPKKNVALLVLRFGEVTGQKKGQEIIKTGSGDLQEPFAHDFAPN